MFTIVAVALGIPSLILLAYLGMRRTQSMPFARSLALARGGDARGIALQTIIIMVVLLAIAGAVAGVLLTRAGQTTQQAETADVTSAIDTPAECTNTQLVGSELGTLNAAGTRCTFVPVGGQTISRSECVLRGGTLAGSGNCRIDFP